MSMTKSIFYLKLLLENSMCIVLVSKPVHCHHILCNLASQYKPEVDKGKKGNSSALILSTASSLQYTCYCCYSYRKTIG